jgi:triphosphatase|tara:strand:+ start:441 stop:1058 length:618 start_codon:yes stop_codon:yes gene_type:complete
MILEQEIKLTIMSDQILDLSVLPIAGYQRSSIETIHLVSTYFDTPSFNLAKQGLGLRLRFDGRNWLQTVKEKGEIENGLHQRMEWEHLLPSKAFNVALLKQTPLQELIEDEKGWETLSPIFTTDFYRKHCLLEKDNQITIELAYDRGRIYTEVSERRIHELELELKNGELHYLKTLAETLCITEPLQPSNFSKAQQGYELASEVG